MEKEEENREVGLKKLVIEFMPFVAMIIVEFLDVGLTTLSKAAMMKGMSHFVFVFYSNLLAAALLLPLSFLLERKKRPPFTLSLMCKFCLLGLIGITIMQNCVFTGVSYSSPTLASAMSNIIPAFTFVLAVIFRMEKLNIKSLRSQIKIMGTLISIAGALTVTLYKGPQIGSSPPHSSSPTLNISIHLQQNINRSSWIIGGIFLAIACLSISIWNIGQAALLKGYPAQLTTVAFYCFFGSIQCGIVTLVAEFNHPKAWKITPDVQLISIIYSAVSGSMISFGILTWCIHKRGPVFVAMFKPLSIAIAAFMSIVFLGETFHVGIIVGAIIIIIGFYGVIWAQSKDREEEGYDNVDSIGSTPQKMKVGEV